MSVVGRGYVTIRAVTSGVERDVQQGVDRALGRVNANDGAEKLGRKIEGKTGQTIGDGKETEKGVKRSLGRTNVDSESEKLGNRIGDKIGKSAGERGGGLLKKLLLNPLTPGLLNQTATLLSSTAAAGVSLASTLGPVLAGGAGVGANALLGLGSALAVVKLAFNKKDLPQFTAQLGPAKAEVDKLSDSLQKRMYPALARSINGIVTGLGPTLRTGLGQTAKSIDHVANRFAAMAQTPLFKTRLAGIFRTNAQALDLFGKAGVTSAGSFLAIANAAGPLTVRFANFTAKLSDNVAQQINAAEASGKLEAFFNRAGDTTAKWGHVLGNTSKALFHVFDSGSQVGGVFLDKLVNVTAKFDQWTQSIEGQRALKDWFDQSIPVMQATGRLLGALGKTFSGLSGGAGPVVTTLDFLSGTVLPALDAGLKVLIPPANALLQVFTSISPVVNTVVPALNAVGDVVGALPTPLQAAVGGLLLFAVAGDKIQAKITGIQGKFTSFGTSIKSTASTMRGGLRGVIADLEIMASTSRVAGARTARELDRSAAAATRLRGRMATLAKGAAVLGAVAVASSGLADKLGLSAVASDALGGAMIGGPIGAGAGALIGVFQSLGSAVSDFRGTLNSVDSALNSTSLEAKKAALAQLQLKASQLATGNSFKDNAERIYAFATGGQNKMVEKSRELAAAIQSEQYAADHLVPVIDAVGNVTDQATGANYHFSASLKAIMGNLTATDAWLNYKQSVLDTKKALEQNGKTIDVNTEKGLANRKAIQAQAEALIQGATAFKDGSAAQDRYLIKGSQGLFKLADSLDKTGKFGDQLRAKFESLGRVKAQPELNVKDNATNPLKAFEAYLKSIGQEKASPQVKAVIGEAMHDLSVFRSTFFGLDGRTVSATVLFNSKVVGPVQKLMVNPNGSRNGGWIPGRAGGGWAVGPGSSTSDSILYNNTMISKREFVVNADEARKNANTLEQINSGTYRGGSGNVTINVNNPFPERSGQSVSKVLKHKVFESGWGG